MTLEYQAAKTVSEPIKPEVTFNALCLGNLLKDADLQINEALDERGLEILLELELQTRYSDICRQYKNDVEVIKSNVDAQIKSKVSETMERIHRDCGFISKVMQDEVVRMILRKFPSLRMEGLGFAQDGENGEDVASNPSADFFALYPELQEEMRRMDGDPITIGGGDFQKCKKSICFIYGLWNQMKGWHEEYRDRVINIASNPDLQVAKQDLRAACKADSYGMLGSFMNRGKLWLGASDHHILVESMLRDADKFSFRGDAEFVADLDAILRRLPSLEELVREAKRALHEQMPKIISARCKQLTNTALELQERKCTTQVKIEQEIRANEASSNLRKRFILALNALPHKFSQRLLVVDSVGDAPRKGHFPLYSLMSSSSVLEFSLSGNMKHRQDHLQRYTIHVMGLNADDRHEIQLNPGFVPAPRFHRSHTFNLSPDFAISRAQLLEDERILLAVTDRQGDLYIYYESLTSIDAALSRRNGKQLHSGKIGENFLLAFDESQRMLCVVSTCNLLHIFVYDDGRMSMQARGTAIPLNKWYQEGAYPCHACFVCGSEELLLIDTQAHARVFSLVTLQFRPAVLDLKQIPVSIYSSPDASCLIVSHKHSLGLRFTAYHWSTFGTTDGIPLDVPQLQVDDSLCLTSLANKVHLLRLDVAGQRCESVALDITRRVTEFTFKEKGARTSTTSDAGVTTHNSLIDCHADVWARFPVVPAVGRETISSENLRNSKAIVFITDRDHGRYSHHFSELVATFERTTKKPGGDVLRKVAISGTPFSTALDEIQNDVERNVSKFLAGEWVVNFLCLIPIHIAITKENRFVPLKDGVYSTDLEKSLLGAGVNRIVDLISFGWYESIFQSYMATKPVKVVSSMGEQSVGKSFALNHLVDTSFAGSAMRTTEGVWMSVTPTQDALIVALDFEGVHSIERSAQEDTLLVLFNTAISNLVLFRNNFALSRDITGLFQSFQSSSTVLDPGENPNLFNSTLMIIIKDVVDSDTREIVREFQLKFQKIVHDEQGSNFITRLHRGQLSILPWPVIESREFYKQFSAIKNKLDRQPVTHNAAGEFLHLMKTLMAKLKANDWGALSRTVAYSPGFHILTHPAETMASHRAQLLLSLLPNALEYGLQETEPEIEPLKVLICLDDDETGLTSTAQNLDTDETIRVLDSDYHFFLAPGHTHDVPRENALSILRQTWTLAPRQHVPDPVWVDGLSEHLETLVNERIEHVREWLAANMSRFQAGHASIEDLIRTFEKATVDLKSNVMMCKLQCHAQQEHQTRHGSMSKTRWSIDGPADASLKIEGRRFSSNDEGAPMMCNIVCQAMGRHVHISPCRAHDPAACDGNDQIQHIHKRLHPNPEAPKDFVTHSLFWRRAGFKDPYSREERMNFAKCDSMCSGPDHSAAAGNPAQPSYCTLPIFHAPRNPAGPAPVMGYVSHDGHVFSCRNPAVMQQAFHVIFVIDRSSSMTRQDRRPLRDTPASARIIRHSDNRFGAVLSSLYSFWLARAATLNAGGQGARRDAYSVLLFNSKTTRAVFNDVGSSPDQLLDTLLNYSPATGTDFTSAIQTAQYVMQQGWSTERTPVIIFLSDGESDIEDQTVQAPCMLATQLGKALSFHAVSFGKDRHSSTLRRMSHIALEAQRRAPRDPLLPAEAIVESSYSEALDTVELAETFLGIARSLSKPRGSLVI
ncbi:hypothetical protein PAXINDRAFT_102749 [Paxillus involutus ATCC 200175]|uniref:VWFA domain-containing protein n=1 Tax=Paxillus involutus ATCC 200175 TaxID=664439 RepID=A0A0C9TIZ9_PAXIN|nr:hypothetical protein PAXINDRAFT_102749 [Paxillus involutus ATCC 200175]